MCWDSCARGWWAREQQRQLHALARRVVCGAGCATAPQTTRPGQACSLRARVLGTALVYEQGRRGVHMSWDGCVRGWAQVQHRKLHARTKRVVCGAGCATAPQTTRLGQACRLQARVLDTALVCEQGSRGARISWDGCVWVVGEGTAPQTARPGQACSLRRRLRASTANYTPGPRA